MIINATTITNDLLQEVQKIVTFSWYDYIFFTLMLACSALIGIYFGCFGNKQASTNEYLMGGKTMKVIPISISLIASHVSGITLLAVPADVYRYGAGYMLGTFSIAITCVVTIYVYLPVFFRLQITSTYEYLELRFDKGTRKFASFLFALSVFLYLPIVVYVPALAFSAATGINVHAITPIVCGVCIFYTTIGGLKAVVWTDTLQFTVTVGAVTTVFILGVKSVGGFLNIWNIAKEGERLDIFDFSLDPTKRDSIWIILVGFTVHLIALVSINQTCIQKFLSLATFHEAKMSVIYSLFGMDLIKIASVLTGLVMYAKYHNCDPFATKAVTRNDQLLPYYVTDVARTIPGLSGLFIAGVFSAALSTLSATLNCLAGTIYEDFLRQYMGETVTERTASNILKLIVIVTGLVSMALVFVIEHLGGILALAISLQSVSNGPLLAMFTLGVLFPRANSKGAFYGSIIGTIVIGWIIFSAKYYQTQGLFEHEAKPISTQGCYPYGPDNTTTDVHDILLRNATYLLHLSDVNKNYSNHTDRNSTTKPFILFRISHYYYTLIATAISMICGLIISYVTSKNKANLELVDQKLLSPVIYFMLPSKETTKLNQDTIGKYYDIKKALELAVNNNS